MVPFFFLQKETWKEKLKKEAIPPRIKTSRLKSFLPKRSRRLRRRPRRRKRDSSIR